MTACQIVTVVLLPRPGTTGASTMVCSLITAVSGWPSGKLAWVNSSRIQLRVQVPSTGRMAGPHAGRYPQGVARLFELRDVQRITHVAADERIPDVTLVWAAAQPLGSRAVIYLLVKNTLARDGILAGDALR